MSELAGVLDDDMRFSLGQRLLFSGPPHLSPTNVYKLVDDARTSWPKPALAGSGGRCLIFGQASKIRRHAMVFTNLMEFDAQKTGYLLLFLAVISKVLS